MRVLVAEDDLNIRRAIVEILSGEGYEPVEAEDGERAIALFAGGGIDFVCLDIMMPRLDGYEVCRRIRRQGSAVPIVFLSAKAEEIDRVLGLELGADDFVMKPFGKNELLARMRAICRRVFASSERRADLAPFFLGPLEVLPAELRVKKGEELVELSLRELKLLQTFARYAGRVLDRDLLFRECWGIEHYPNSRTLDQHISKLRKKIEDDPKNPRLIKTVHGAGYRYEREEGA